MRTIQRIESGETAPRSFTLKAILRKNRGRDMRIKSIGRKIVRVQIGWVVVTILVMLLTVVYNIGYAHSYTKNYLSYLLVAIAMYFVNRWQRGITKSH